jgi:sulfite exporter TauE/SafE/copper chaperone CopZ
MPEISHDIPTSAGEKPSTTTSYQESTLVVCVEGMTCRSCEIIIERTWKKLPSVKNVTVDATIGQAKLTLEGLPPTLKELQAALGQEKYRISQIITKESSLGSSQEKRPSLLTLIGLFALVILLSRILTGLGLFTGTFSLGTTTSFGAIFIIGLIAASSSCIAIVGGLLLSTTAKFNEHYGSAKPLARMRPVVLFITGRIIGYTVLGGLIGVVGSVLAPSPVVTAIITIIAALYMLVMGLEMLHLAPHWLKKVLPRLPKGLAHRIMDAEGREHPLAPALLGAATFFLPCGFTQALQLYALTTHSFSAGALSLLAFALGTAPALLALGWASSTLKGKVGKFFFQFSGALVVVLGLWNIQNGLAIAGHPISLHWPTLDNTTATLSTDSQQPLVTTDGNTQVITMGFSTYGQYQPNHFTLQANKKVRWNIDGTKAAGCANVLASRQLGIQTILKPGINTIEFTPTEPGEIAFNCSMGMIRGSFTVTP